MTTPTTLGVNVADTASAADHFGALAGIRLDIGCGANRQQGAGWVGMDVQPLSGVDIVHDLTKFPWPIESESVLTALASHILEHIQPEAPDARLVGLLKLLLDKGVISRDELADYIGTPNPGPLFIAVMNEVWRVLKPNGQFAIIVPHAYSAGFAQDPTHVNPINENTWLYFLPEHPFYNFYRPRPWRLEYISFDYTANIEITLRKVALV
jgi:predicted SAM-dependent methyltransferase